MNEVITTNLAEFGYREKEMARDLLSAMLEQGLPKDFYDDGVTIMMNKNSGNVFLTNSEYQVAMINSVLKDGVVVDKLESWYTTPYKGLEGFYDELMQQYNNMHDEDKEYMDNITAQRG